jgi:hypothetical protein
MDFVKSVSVHQISDVYFGVGEWRSAFGYSNKTPEKTDLVIISQLKISSGAISVAQDTLEYLVRQCSNRMNNDLRSGLFEIQQKSLNDVTRELIRQVIMTNFVIKLFKTKNNFCR